MLKFFTKKRIIIGAGVLLILLAAFGVFRKNQGSQEVIAVERGNIQEEVVVTGKVKAESQVDLAFDQTGRVARVYAQVGDRVAAGRTIAELDYSETAADLAREQGILNEEEVKLEAAKQTGPSSLKEAQTNLASAVREAYASADSAVRNKADQFFVSADTNPRFEVKITNGNYIHYFDVPSDLVLELNNERRTVESILDNWPTDADKAIASLNTISSFLDRLALVVNSFSTPDYTYESTVAGYKTTVDAARTAVSNARASIIAAQQNVSAGPVLGSSGVSSVAAQEAKVNQIKSSIASIQASINKSRITAPFEGVIAVQDAKTGETVNAGQTVASLISDTKYVEANVSEINVGKVKVGDKANIEFDGLPGQTFVGHVAFIDPAETIIDQVVNYKLRIEFEPDSRLSGSSSEVKSGLTSTVKIETMNKDNVLAIPSYAVSKENGKSFVTLTSSSSKAMKREIQTGITGSDGRVEVVSGLSEGEKILFTK